MSDLSGRLADLKRAYDAAAKAYDRAVVAKDAAMDAQSAAINDCEQARITMEVALRAFTRACSEEPVDPVDAPADDTMSPPATSPKKKR